MKINEISPAFMLIKAYYGRKSVILLTHRDSILKKDRLPLELQGRVNSMDDKVKRLKRASSFLK